MKKILFITLFFSLNISYASFPVEKNYVEKKEFNLNESKINTKILSALLSSIILIFIQLAVATVT